MRSPLPKGEGQGEGEGIEQPTTPPNSAAAPPAQGCLIWPSPSNAVQLRLYTNASASAAHLFNTFDLLAYGETLIQSPGGNALNGWRLSGQTNLVLHSLLVNGSGPELAGTNSLSIIEHSSGPEWSYIALDGTATYRSELNQYRRGILYIQPDLIIVHDRMVAREPAKFQMFLHPPDATSVDKLWHDLHLDLPKARLVVHAPSSRKALRSWEKLSSPADDFFPRTVTMRLGPTNQLAELDVVTVFAARPAGEKMEFAFKLLESNTAVGARIHRDGLPTLVAFKTSARKEDASLTGFGFNGPVGVSIFKPKRK
jgi:hypothetical protein